MGDDVPLSTIWKESCFKSYSSSKYSLAIRNVIYVNITRAYSPGKSSNTFYHSLIVGNSMTTKYSCSLAKVSGVNMASQFHTTGICAHWWLRCPEAVAHQLSLCKPPSGHQCLPRCMCFSPVKRCVSQKVYPHIYTHTHITTATRNRQSWRRPIAQIHTHTHSHILKHI